MNNKHDAVYYANNLSLYTLRTGGARAMLLHKQTMHRRRVHRWHISK